jgi:hypothetical protein
MQSEGDPAAVEALATFANRISEQRVRRDFDNDPLGTLEGIGVDVGALPDEVRDFLTDLTYEELRLLARMQQKMVDSGLYVKSQQGVSLGHL